jgi:hypothetical protein
MANRPPEGFAFAGPEAPALSSIPVVIIAHRGGRVMKRATPLSCLAALAVTTAAWADSLQPAQIPATARWVIHLDFERLRQGELGRFCLAQLSGDPAGHSFAALAAVYNFDPRRDLLSATFAGKSNRPEDGVAIFRGAFDAERLITLLKASSTYQCQTNGDVAIHSWVDGKNAVRQYAAIRRGDWVAISQASGMLIETLETIAGCAPGQSPTGWPAGLSATGAFFVATLQAESLGPAGDSRILAQSEQTQIALAEKNDTLSGSILLNSKDAVTASNVFAVAQGLLGLAWMNREKNPAMAEFAAAVRLHREGCATRVEFAYPVSKALAVMEAEIAKAREAKARAATTLPPPAPSTPAAVAPPLTAKDLDGTRSTPTHANARGEP